MNRLYYGDNLDVLRNDIATESVDLVYLDPPFNSNRSYNILFAHKETGAAAEAQIEAFGDTWTWDYETEQQYIALIHGAAPSKVADAISAMYGLLGPSDVLAYLVMMTPRLVELNRVLKPTGSLYLHCDPTASHYLKLILDASFGPENFVNEIIWKRSSAHSDGKQGSAHYGRVSDTILFYSKTRKRTWNTEYQPYDEEYVNRDYRRIDESGRRYRLSDISGPGGAAKGNPYYEVMGVSRHWRYSKGKMDELIAEGRIIQTRPGAVPQYKRYLDEMPGTPVQNIWTDIPVINNRSRERLGYPTQKPVALLERIIAVSSKAGDLILDPFCGCGTSVAAAHKLRRSWVGIDITFLAIDIIDKRLRDTYGQDVASSYKIRGIPRDLEGARSLFQANPFDFERWAVSLVNGQPNDRQVGDKGIDGVIRFAEVAEKAAKPGRILVSVKGGTQLGPAMVRDLIGTVSSQHAQMGLLLTLTPPTKGMIEAADHAGTYIWPWDNETYPKVQIITVSQLLAGERPNAPQLIFLPYIQAQASPVPDAQLTLPLQRGRDSAHHGQTPDVSPRRRGAGTPGASPS